MAEGEVYKPYKRPRESREWSISALCDQLGSTHTTLSKKLHGVPYRFDAKLNAKLYLLPDVIKAISAGNRDPKAPDIEASKARKVAAEAGIAEIEFAKARGEVIELDLIERVLTEEYTAVRAKMLNIPSKLAPILDTMPNGIDAKRDLLMREIAEALEELEQDAGIKSLVDLAVAQSAGEAAYIEDTEGEEDRVPSSATSNGKRVVRRKAKAKS